MFILVEKRVMRVDGGDRLGLRVRKAFEIVNLLRF